MYDPTQKNTSELSQKSSPLVKISELSRVGTASSPLPTNYGYHPITLTRSRALNDAIVSVLHCQDLVEGVKSSPVIVPVELIEELWLQQESFLDLVDFGAVQRRPWCFNVPGCS